jgi:hypothetical protein
MRSKLALCVVLALATSVLAKEPKHYDTGKLIQMDSIECGKTEKDAKSLAGEMIGTDSGSKQTRELLCQEYLVQSDRVIYRVRPRDEKHPVLLPIGETARFRLEKDKLYLRVGDDEKERAYTVVSMTPRSDGATAESGTHKP